jgi:hypothetical protein
MHSTLERPAVYHPVDELHLHVAAVDRSVADCAWFRPVKIATALLDQSELDPAQRELLERLMQSFEAGGHTIQSEPTRDSDIILAFHSVPAGDSPIQERMEEIEPLVAMQVRDRYDLEGLHPNLILVISVPDDLAALPHVEVENVARMAMGRIGSFKVLFIKTNPETGAADYYIFATIEGGHPTIDRSDPDCFNELRDRLVTHACANEAGGYTAVRDAIPQAEWDSCRTVDYLIDVGQQLGAMGHLDPPVDAAQWISPQRAQLVRFLLGWQRQAPGAMIAFAPDLRVPAEYRSPTFTGVPIVTCTGREEVDKTNMRRDEVVAVSLRDDTLYAFGVEGQRLKAPSIEGDELVGGMMASPPVRLSEHRDGYVFDPDGDIVVPRIWAIVHTHRGVEEVSPIQVDGREVHVVEHIRPNVEEFPYAVGCGKDMMFDISRDGMARSTAAMDFDSPAVVGMFDVANHGTNFFLYCAPRPGTNVVPRNPFENLLALLDPDGYAAIKLTTEVPQF